MTAAVQPKARARYAAKREAILAAATNVFADHGVSGFTLAAVAKRMDLHPVSLTYYYKRKEDLAAAVLMDTIGRWGVMLDRAEQEATPQQRLRTFIAAHFETRRQVALGAEIPLAPFSEINLVAGEQNQPLIDAFHSIYIRIARILRSDDMPWMSAPRRHALSRLTVSTLTWSDAWLTSYAPDDYARVANRIADVMIDGIQGEGQAWPTLDILSLESPTAENDEVTRDKFLVAATKLINKEGYRGASVDKISAELKVTKGSFYHHNADKDELAAACFVRTFGLIEDGKRRADAMGSSGWERLWLATASLATQQAAGEDGKMLRHYAIAAVPPSMRADMLARFRQIAHAFAGALSDGIADGSVRPVDPLLAARYLMVVFNAAQPLEKDSPSIVGLMEAYVRPALLGYFIE